MLSSRIARTARSLAGRSAALRRFSTAEADLDAFGTGATYSLKLSDEQNALKELAREFAMKEMIPVAAEYDRTMAFPQPVFEKAWELGLVNTHVPEECGGLGAEP